MLTFLKKLRRDERGVSALEYAILAGVIVAALAVVLKPGSDSTGFFGNIFSDLKTKVEDASK